MGETNTRLTETERSIEQRDSRDSSTETTETKRGRGRPRGTTKTEKTLVPRVVNVTIPGEEEEPKPVPKKKTAARKKTPAKVDNTQIKMMLLTLSGVIASRPGMEVWNLSLEEAEQIADPLAKLMAKNEALANVAGEHADALALVAAIFMICIPKFIMYKATKPKKPKQGEQLNYGDRKPTKPQLTKGTSDGDTQLNDRKPTDTPKTNGQNFGGQLSELIPTTAGF